MKEAESIRDTVIGKGQVKNACLLKCTLSPLRHRSLRNYRWLCTERYTFYYPVYLYRRVPLENGTTVILSIYIIMYICILLFIYIYIFTYSMYIRPRVLKLVVIFAFRCHTTWRDNVCNKTNLFSCLP